MRRNTRLALALSAAIGLLTASEAALASHRPGHPGQCAAAVCQYVEQIPTSGGSQATLPGGKARTTPLAPALRRRLFSEAGKDAALLEQIATSSAFGAPQTPARTQGKKGKKGNGASAGPGRASGGDEESRPRPSQQPSLGKSLSAVGAVVTDGSEGRLIGLLVVLLLITALAVLAAAFRQRLPREPLRP